jgi:beta-lactamase superfamily II metal-dependent hydrolase
MAARNRFAGYPAAVAYAEPDGEDPVQHLLWGSYIRDKGEKKGRYKVKDVHGEVVRGRYVRTHIRGRRPDCWIREHEIQDERLLEVIFVDIGQGDGCLVITPEDKHMVIDAGEGDNMYRFLRWRFGRFREKFTFQAGVISHPDADHYKGFEHLFADPNVFFETLYHNGIVERFGKNSLGSKRKIGRRTFLTGLVTSKSQLKTLLSVTSRWKKTSGGRPFFKQYPTMLKKALDAKKFGKFEMLSAQDGYMPGYGPDDEDEELLIEVLGPIVEPADADPPRLRWITNTGKTKNGHSVVLRLQYRDVSLLLGGDLNIPSENLLLSYHTGMDCPPKTTDDEEALVEAGRDILQVDIAKSCHHGSSDFSHLFLRAVNPIATVISSGDNEPHSHPRADALGSLGLHSRGARPLIFSTELARSAKETIKHPNILRRRFNEQLKDIVESPASTDREKKTRDKKRADFEKEMDRVLDRSVAVFGAIGLVTNGREVVIAQKLEQARSKGKKWDIYRLEAEGHGPLRYQSKH